ncbi:MAG: hypothetical protein GY842_28315, partial [bacterium]|nr:hypothetical protein [bacterium]
MRMKLRNDKPQSQQSPAPAVWVPALLVVLPMASFGLMSPVLAGTLTALASYEPSETDLTLTPHVGDLGLDLSIVPGGVGGVPPATDGAYVVKLDFAGEDGKVEFRHDWSSSTYDLSDQDEL